MILDLVSDMDIIRKLTTEHDLHLQDESRKRGHAETVSFPVNDEEISEIVKYCNENDIPITVQGSRTGVGSGAVPFGGHVMSLEKLRGMKMGADGDSVVAGAACTLKEICDFVKRETSDGYFLPPDPTERTASAGGMISCNSSGARTYRYGAIRNYVKALKLILADGRTLRITRGEQYAEGRKGILKLQGTSNAAFAGTNNADEIPVMIPEYTMPKTKNAAGYYATDNMDMIDLFIGAEGTLGIITEVEFSLVKKPKLIWGAIVYFREDEMGISFADKMKKAGEDILSIEFFDRGSLNLLRENGWKIPGEYSEAVFTEIKAENRDEMVESIRKMEDCIIEAGGYSNDAWIAGSSRSFETFKELRHATPESVNGRIAEIKKSCPVITKLGSDMSVPDEAFHDIVSMYKRDLKEAGLYYVMFGHIGNNHLHVNIISRNEEEYFKGKEIFGRWADEVRKRKGSVSAEHGVGKLKRDFLIKMYGDKAVDEMREMKKSLDPKGIFGRDNIFVWNKSDK